MGLIDTDVLIENLKNDPVGKTMIAHYNLDGFIKSQPTVDAEPVRHGKWIFNPSDAFEAMFAKPKCSECGFESADGGNYCPNCGADMRGEKDG